MKRERRRPDQPPVLVIADTSVCSTNVGDQVISGALRRGIGEILDQCQTFTVPTHTGIGYRGRRLLRVADVAVVSGTNLLSATVDVRQQWRALPLPPALRRYVLAGVGWGSGDDALSFAGRAYLRYLLHPDALHGTRDRFTAEQLISAGFRAVFTGCPTTWELPARADQITRAAPSRTAVIALNHVAGHEVTDRLILKASVNRFDECLLWLQSPYDVELLKVLPPNVRLLPPNVAALQSFIVARGGDVDFVGTRLHAAIATMACGARATLFALDKRTQRMGADSSLPHFAEPRNVDDVLAAIEVGNRPRPTVPTADVAMWKDELRRLLPLDWPSKHSNG